MSINWLYQHLSGILDQLTPEDQQFIQAYWQVIFRSLITYQQRILEGDLEATLVYALPTNKTWYTGLVTEYEWEDFTVTAVPMAIPPGTKEYKGYGATIYTTIAVTLPIDMGEDVTIVRVTGATHTIDGTKILGNGIATVEYYTSLIANPIVVDGYLTDSAVTTLSCYRTPYDPIVFSGIGEVLFDGTLWDPDIDFTNIPIGTVFTLWAAPFTVKEIVDAHTIQFTALIPMPGRKIPYTHEAYQYIVPTVATSIPAFDNGWVNGTDFIIQDDKLGFLATPPDTLIADRTFFYNNEIYDNFGKLIGLNIEDGELPQDYLNRLLARWYGIFAGVTPHNLELVLHMLMGLPTTVATIGEVTADTIEVEIVDLKEQIGLAVDKWGFVSTDDVDYFTPGDKHIMWDDGGFSKIIRYYDPQQVLIDGYRPAVGISYGKAAILKNFVVSVFDQYGITTNYSLQYPCVPTYKPGDVIPIWSKLCTGVRVYDARMWKTNAATDTFDCKFVVPDCDAYLAPTYVPAADERPNQLLRSKQLRGNVFVIEFDLDAIPDLSFVSTISQGETEYQVRRRVSSLTMRDEEVTIS